MTDNTSRRGYLNDIGNGWLHECEVRCFRNFMHNWDGCASDSDFFDLFRDGDALGDSSVIELLSRHFDLAALENFDGVCIGATNLHGPARPGRPSAVLERKGGQMDATIHRIPTPPEKLDKSPRMT